MKVLVVGSGGREHAIAWKLSHSSQVSEIYNAPGNPGMAKVGENLSLAVDDLEGIKSFCLQQGIDLVVVGPEYPLSLGLVDVLCAAGITTFGPTKAAAQMESSKAFAKEIMLAAGVPTASYERFTSQQGAIDYVQAQGAPIVVKADGLAAGKGVFVCQTVKEANEGIEAVFSEFESAEVVIEEMLQGVEVSYIVATDGTRIVPLAASHDYKRIFDGDQGPNTGGMGTVSPTPRLSVEQETEVLSRVIEPVLEELRKRGTPFCGFLYAGLMISPEGEINVIEFNARLGDPETQVIMRRLESDLLDILYPLASSAKELPAVSWIPESAVCVTLASKGYPQSSHKGDVITGIESAEANASCVVFHAGTSLSPSGELVTGGGRVLSVTSISDTLENARLQAYQACELISFDGCQYRKDIGLS
ncbi:MAG: phosphoribosylamine--glycine ligase [Bdellovibrionales bacterium]|nr:phosphoribosylamine--glycine ligase [Bdellovibrionales bacterium]